MEFNPASISLLYLYTISFTTVAYLGVPWVADGWLSDLRGIYLSYLLHRRLQDRSIGWDRKVHMGKDGRGAQVVKHFWSSGEASLGRLDVHSLLIAVMIILYVSWSP